VLPQTIERFKRANILIYQGVDESTFEKIALASTSAWNILKTAKRGVDRVIRARLLLLRGRSIYFPGPFTYMSISLCRSCPTPAASRWKGKPGKRDCLTDSLSPTNSLREDAKILLRFVCVEIGSRPLLGASEWLRI